MTNQEIAQWIETLKVGDKVAVSGSGAGGCDVIRTVTAVHKIHIAVGHTKYRKIDGRSAGRNAWHWTDIRPVTDELRRAIAGRVARGELAKKVLLLADADAVRILKLVSDALAEVTP